MTSLVLYEHDNDYVLERFCQGEFDFIDAVSEAMERDFFSFIAAENLLLELAETYPSPRKKHEVPVWFYIASNIAMRLHGVHSYERYPYVVRCGGMINVFGPDAGHKVVDPNTGDVTVSCGGFNDKNSYDRQTPCDKDYLRKFSRDSNVEAMMNWFNNDAAKLLKKHGALDNAGLFIGDASYLFVPDNDKYEGSSLMRFDEHDKPVSKERFEKMSIEQKSRCNWRRCYKLVSLLHTDRKHSFCMMVAFRLVPGQSHESPIFYDLVDDFVAGVGAGVVKRLILDRGFIDGPQIGHLKVDHKIDVLIPIRKNMVIYEDVMGLLELPTRRWRPYETPQPSASASMPSATRPDVINKREKKRQETLRKRKESEPTPAPEKTLVRSEVATFGNNTLWESCPVPLNVIVNRDTYGDGHEDIWVLVDTKALKGKRSGSERRTEYKLRMRIEESYRQIKCFWNIGAFTSTKLSLIINQVVFVLLTHNLLQRFLRRQGKSELNRRTPQNIQAQLQPTQTVIIIYCHQRFATLSPAAFAKLCITLPEAAKAKALRKLDRIDRQVKTDMQNPRAP